MGFAAPTTRTPGADSGSTIFSAGFTPATQQSGEPSGGVTSTRKVATRSGSAANAIAEMRNRTQPGRFIVFTNTTRWGSQPPCDILYKRLDTKRPRLCSTVSNVLIRQTSYAPAFHFHRVSG